MRSRLLLVGLVFVLLVLVSHQASAQPLPAIPNLELRVGTAQEPEQIVQNLQLLALLTVLSLVPAILILVTSFTRIVVVLALLRDALGTQQTPPNQILIGLALILTFFVMAPVYQTVRTDAINPYLAGSISEEDALSAGEKPLKEFMLKETREKDLALFVSLTQGERPQTKENITLGTLVPAFLISELKTAFQIGFLIFIPFLIIDMVVASTLMAMGMFMVPPVMVSLPFKLLLFVLVDGWYLVVKSLMASFT